MSKNSSRTHSKNSTKTNKGMEAQVLVAIITGLTAIILALFGFPPFIGLFQKDPTPTVSSTSTDTPTATTTIEPAMFNTATAESNSPTPTVTETLVPTTTQTLAPTIIVISTATVGLPIGMNVQLVTDITSGRSPLTVHFDARGSFLRDANGDFYNCSVCNYTWYVYQDFDLLNEPKRSDNGTFSYRFGRDGEYRVVVRVCRGQGDSDCGYDAEDIAVR